MNRLNKKLFVIIAAFIAGSSLSVNAQVVYFNGLGRALVTSESLSGNILQGDTSRPGTVYDKKDSTSTRKSTGGYTVFDLGVNVQPNETLRASAILRVKNSFGGFYGDGSNLVFRQIRLDGIIGKKVKYEIGDIDLELSKYTLYNFDEMYHDYESDVFAIRRSVVAYENFNFGNKWRVQGFNASTTFKFDKIIEKIGVRAFAARTKKTNYLNSPDRLLVGGRLELIQSKYFQIGANYVRLFDLAQTAPVANVAYTNDAVTTDLKLNYDGVDDLEFSIYGETGMSANSYVANNITAKKGTDYFYDGGVSAKYKPLNLKVFGSYREVGFNYSSPTAQTRRIYDYGANIGSSKTDFTSEFAQLQNLPQYQNGLGIAGTAIATSANHRMPVMWDRMSDEYIRNTSIQTSLLPYLPQYNNVTPYGQATPNRKGITLGASAGDVGRLLKTDITLDLLTQVVAEDAADSAEGNLKKYMAIRGGVLFNLHKLLRFEKTIAINFGARYEKTTRNALANGSNSVDFNSMIIDAGLTVEIIKQLDLIGGYKLLTAKGNEYVSYRDALNNVVGIISFVDVNEVQGLLAYGIRYRFSKNTYFTAQGISSDNTFSQSNLNYGVNQLFLNYTMIF